MDDRQSGRCRDGHRSVELIDKLTLEDQGQALKTLYVVNGVIVYSGLVQRLFWEQRSLVAESFVEGVTITVNGMNDQRYSFRVETVTRITRALRYAAWLEQVDQLALVQWNERDYTKRSGAHTPGDSWIEPYLEGLSPLEAWEIEKQAASVWSDAVPLASNTVNGIHRARISPSRVMR